MTFPPIAIVGRACVLPGALSPGELWERVRAGADLLSAAPRGRWRVRREAVVGTAGSGVDAAWTDRGGYVEGFDAAFDPAGFAVPEEQVQRLDPLVRWLLHVSREALREAGVEGGPRVAAVYGNLSFPSAAFARRAERAWLGPGLAGAGPLDPRDRFMSGLPVHIVARALGLGPGFALDAACASSLYAIKLACDLLHDRRADVALAGAVNAADDLFIHVGFTALQALSRSGRSRPFHRDADGLLPAEGAGAVALKRLEDAEAAGDRIFGVIRGVGLANDGRGRGLLAPAEEGQERAMRAAYAAAGLLPADMSLLECHATGTAVGDAVEARSAARVFAGAADLPIGSLKSNFGHAVTAAGIAGLLKLVGALAAGVRPPTLHADDPLPLLAGTPLRLLREAEPWETTGVRRAAVSAFGFGGANAHLIVEEHAGSVRPRYPGHRVASAVAAPEPPPAVAVVGVGAAVGAGRTASDFAAALFSQETPATHAATTISLPVVGTRFPPHDLAAALPQQTWILAAGREALDGVRLPPSDRSGALIGMECDPAVARYGARWRLPDLAAACGVTDEAWLCAAVDTISPPLSGAGVLGAMPNLPANRLNVQFDLAGPGYTIAAGELSGVRALQVALRALRAGELDLALAGAADFSCDPVHEAAARELGLPGPSGDGAVVVALKRLEDARRDGDRVYALIDDVMDAAGEEQSAGAGDEGFSDRSVADRFGRAHAAFGLVRVLAAVTACAAARRPGGGPWPGERRVRLVIGALGGQRASVGVRAADALALEFPSPASTPEPTADYQAHRPAPELPPLPVPPITMRPAPALESVSEFESRRTPGDVLDDARNDRRDTRPRPAPAATPAAAGGEDLPPVVTLSPAPRLARVAAEATASPTATIPVHPVPPPAGIPAHLALAQIAVQVALATRVHRAFLEDQAAANQQFLDIRERTAATLLAAANNGVLPHAAASPAFGVNPRPVRAREPESVSYSSLAREQSVQSNVPSEGVARRGGLQRRSEASTMEVRSDRTPQPARETDGVSLQGLQSAPIQTVTGIPFDRHALEMHATGKISALFGERFADQDALSRRVRMPAPPLLLADRVVRLEGQPLALGTGEISTETDVSPGAWYLHDNRMPAGIMVEAGQADLLLVSWLGVDSINRGERVYRLLGCELTYHGGLPVAGETLRYDIAVDGHAQQGAVRLFFFHSTCTAAGVPRLTVRGGQAGFFTDEELSASAGVLWDPATAVPREPARVDPPVVSGGRTRLSREHLEALAAGRADLCFGPAFAAAAAHTRTPCLPGGRSILLEEVTEIAAGGGPWGRGYLRAVDRIAPDDWFFQGHFTNDPCMPGTLMLDGCLQTMAVYLAASGCTLERDGWRFEPVQEQPYLMRCRGQVTPSARELVYEVFVEEAIFGPEPTLYADILCTVDGLKAFHCRRMGLRLVPGWPLDSQPALLEGVDDTAAVASAGDLRFDGRSLLACAWGRPTAAFGPAFRAFDGARRLARLPGPPYQFMSRVTKLEGEMGAMREGSAVEVEYDIPTDAWYFAANGARTMPFAVLLEAALQPCGWLATWAGSPLTTERDLSFRNLDGDGRLLAEVFPGDGALRTRAVLTRISRSAGMLIEGFDVRCSVGDRLVYELKTVFGYFPAEALARQVGLPAAPGEREALEAACEESVDLRAWRAQRIANEAGPRPATAPLLMLDRVTGIWPAGGPAGLGRYRAETEVDPAAWFFKAHFFQDPVQPGSLGLEAMLQLLQFTMIRAGLAGNPGGAVRFEPLALGEQHTWKYRGQVLPRNRRVVTLLDVVRTGEDERGPLAAADAALWVDGTKIYEARGLAMRIVPAAAASKPDSAPGVAGEDGARSGSGTISGTGAGGASETIGSSPPAAPVALPVDGEVLDPGIDTWLQDHRPTWTVPALPLMAMVDRLARAAASRALGMRVVAVEDVRALRWVPVAGPLRLESQVVPAGESVFDVTLLAWREAANESLSRFEPIATGRVHLAPGYEHTRGTDLKSTPSCTQSVPPSPDDELGEGVARRGGLRRRTEGSTAEARSDRTRQPAREQRASSDAEDDLGEGVARRGGLRRRTEGSTAEVRSDRTPQPERDPKSSLSAGLVPDEPWPPPSNAIPAPDPYAAGTLFHGPAFQLLRSLAQAPGASSSFLDAAAGGAPRGLLHEALLDALTHGIPHDRLSEWSPQIPADRVAYPHRVASLRLFAPLPGTGEVRCETRFAGFDGDPRFPRFQVQAVAAGRVIASLDLVEVLFPKGALGAAPSRERRAFLRDHLFVPGLRLSREEDGTTLLADADVRASDWLPGTLATAYAAGEDLPLQIAVKEHVAARALVHPSHVSLAPGAAPSVTEPPGKASILVSARCPSEPLTVRRLAIERAAGAVLVRDAAPPTLDLTEVREWWDGYYRIGRWPVEDIYFGLAGRFVRHVRLADPAGFNALRGKGVLYLANHQVGIESILFSLIASALSGILTVTLAKIEHRTTWLGNLIRHAFAWPGAHDPGVITYFDRSNREELPRIIGVLAREIAGGGKSVMIHVEGTRALTCRAPVQKMSGAFLDMAIATGAPVVPVRFARGLPVEPLSDKLEYPVGMGGLEITIGAAITPAELASLPYKERKERAIDAINALGPPASEELPSRSAPGFEAAVRAWAERTGASPEHAALFETLRRLDDPGERIAQLLEGARTGRLLLRDDERGRWLAELACRLYGPRGPAATLIP